MNKAFFLGCCALLLVAPLAAQEMLRDPTRPPDAQAVGGDGAELGGAGVFRLDLVKRPASGKPSAVINGELVELGGQIQGMKLVAINDAGVVLAGKDGKERIALSPGVEKSVRGDVQRRASAKAVRGGTKQ